MKNPFYCEGNQTLQQAAQKGCEVFIFGDTQSPNGQCAEQPGIALA